MATKTVTLSNTFTATPDSGAPTVGLSSLAFAIDAFNVEEYQVNAITIASATAETLTPNNTAGSGQTAFFVAAKFAAAETTKTFAFNVDALAAETCPGYIAAGGCTTSVTITNNGALAADFHYIFYRPS